MPTGAGFAPLPKPRWDDRYPGRLAAELQRFKDAGISPRIDQEAASRNILTIAIDWPMETGIVPLSVTYPDSFPHVRPIVVLGEDYGPFPKRHCSPDGTLCLIGRSSAQWTPSTTAYDLLDTQLAAALSGSGEEDPQGEPSEFWWNAQLNDDSYILIDSAFDFGEHSRGYLKLHGTIKGNPAEVKCAILDVLDDKKISIGASNALFPQFISSIDFEVAWIRCDRDIRPGDGDSEYIGNMLKDIYSWSKAKPIKTASTSFSIVALVYPTEVGFSHTGTSILFLSQRGNPRNLEGKKSNYRIIRTLRSGKVDFSYRQPLFPLLNNKSCAVIGSGSLGSNLLIELARNGVGYLTIVDQDIVEPGNSVRWALGAPAWGKRKVDALKKYLDDQYPYVKSNAIYLHIGQIPQDTGKTDREIISDIFDNMSLIADCSAEVGIEGMLWDIAQQSSKSLLSSYGTATLEGGVVAFFLVGDGCPVCLQYHFHDGSIPRPAGSHDDASLIQPVGCSERTFQGASYQVTEIALQASRVAVRLLTASTPSKSFVDIVSWADGLPSWCRYEFSNHKNCGCKS